MLRPTIYVPTRPWRLDPPRLAASRPGTPAADSAPAETRTPAGEQERSPEPECLTV